jgi:hypothetical protein
MEPKRRKQVVTFTLDPELVERLKAWIAKQDLPPPQNAVVARAITKFLDEDEKKGRKSQNSAVLKPEPDSGRA